MDGQLSRQRHGVLIAVLLATLLSPTSARAERGGSAPPDVVEAAERGRQLFDEGQYEEAARVLQQAYESLREPIFLQYIGRCEQALGRPCEAARYYRQYLDEGDPPGTVRGQLEGRLTQLDDECEAATAPPEPEPEPDPEPEDAPPPTTFGAGRGEAPEPPSTRGTDIAGGVLLGLGGTLAVVATIFWVNAQLNYNEWNATFTRGQCALPVQNRPEGDDCAVANGMVDGIDRDGMIGDGLGLAAAIPLAVAGAIILMVGRLRARRHDRATQVTFESGFGSTRLGVEWF